MASITLPFWYDLHVHLRQDALLQPCAAAHKAMGCAGVLAMPNTQPPVSRVHGSNTDSYWTIESYKKAIDTAAEGAFSTIIVPLYLTGETTPKIIAEGAASGLLRAAKYYPPHGTTNAGHSAHIETLMHNGVIEALEAHNIVLCIHGEESGLDAVQYYDQHRNAEQAFYDRWIPELVQRFPKLRIVCEHITTKTAADMVHALPNHIGATITPQHLLFTIGDLLKRFKPHLYCMPIVKFEEDRTALQNAATAKNNTKFFAGTDSAPHTVKATDCGCAAGCFTGGIAPQLYAHAFAESGYSPIASKDNAARFERFLCQNGAAFYGLPVPEARFTLSDTPSEVTVLETPAGSITPLPLGMGEPQQKTATLPWSIAL